ncbi:MAG TPA: PilZ domain-containing protein [Gammaproteobacteria bacterium]|nr:PilZ domain-containing protein [Gammaproteobacteria bacterium]
MGSENKGKTQDTETANGSGAEDKRRTDRHTLALDTEVHFHEQSVKGMFRCRTGNIGLDGVFLPSEQMPIISKTNIELVFHAHAQPDSKQYRIAAKVVRTAADGAALVFCPEDDQQVQGLRHFLLKAKVASRQ